MRACPLYLGGHMARKVRILNIAGAMAYGVDESEAGKVISVEPTIADALVGMRFAEEVERKAEAESVPEKKTTTK